MPRPALPTTYVKGQGAHRDDHQDLATITRIAMLTDENFGGDSAPASLTDARTNLGLGSAATSNLASTTPAATAASGSVGVGTTVARADHVHASPQLSSASPAALGSAAAGAGTASSKDDHVHPTTGLLLTSNLSSATPSATAASGSAGSSSNTSKADHVHASPQLSSSTPVALGSASAGSGTASSKDDHVHPTTGLLLTSNLSSATPSALASAGSAGSSTNVSKADHAHGVNTGWTDYTPTLTNVTVGSGGSTAGRYMLVDANLMLVYAFFALGSSGFSVSGAISVSLPGGVTGYTTVTQRISCSAFDSSADTTFSGQATAGSTTFSSFRFNNIAGTGTTTVPFTWAASDNLRIWGFVELA